MKGADFTVISAPESVTYTCPYCGYEHDVDYDDFSDDREQDDYPFGWVGEIVVCEADDCGKEFKIETLDWD